MSQYLRQMDLTDRIKRRRNGHTNDRLVVDWDALNPAYHLPEPVGRTALLEALLDAIDPVFQDQLPPSVYLWGPPGSGKSAIVTAVIDALDTEFSRRRTTFTATRGQSAMSGIRYVYVDGRRSASRFKLYHRFLNGLTQEPIPERGIGTSDLIEDISAELEGCAGVVLALDHLSRAGDLDLATVEEYLEPFSNVSLLAVGRTPPTELPFPLPSEQVHVPGYRYELVDVLTVRGTQGLSRTLDHAHARRIADWADGNAHDALTVLYLAAIVAEAEDASRIHLEHIEEAFEDVPHHGEALSDVLALTETERSVLHGMLSVDPHDGLDIDDMADEVAAVSDLSRSTIKRLLYELAQDGILERVQLERGNDLVGRRPSMVQPNFSPRVFSHVLNR